MKNKIKKIFDKVSLTIKSCETPHQLEGAKKMVKNFDNLYGGLGSIKILSYKLNKLINKHNKWKQF